MRFIMEIRKIKIVHIQLLPMLSGVQNVSLEELKRLSDTEYEKYIICKENGPLSDEATKLGIRVLYCKSLVREISPLKDFKAFMELVKIIKHYEFDIVHTHSAKPGILGRLSAKYCKVRNILHTVHGFPFDAANNRFVRYIYVFLERVVLHVTDTLICLHDADGYIAKKMLNCSAEKLAVIPNGVNLKKFSPVVGFEKNNIRKENKTPEDAIVFITVGRLWEQKNPQCFIDAAIIFLRSNERSNVQFHIVGDGELRDQLELSVLQSGFDSKIVFWGWQNDVLPYLKASDVYVLPSKWEGMPLATLEAQAVGLPSIVSNIPGNLSTVRGLIDGLVFDLDNTALLSDCFVNMLDSKVRTEFSKNALDKIKEHHNIDDRIIKIQALYQSRSYDL